MSGSTVNPRVCEHGCGPVLPISKPSSTDFWESGSGHKKSYRVRDVGGVARIAGSLHESFGLTLQKVEKQSRPSRLAHPRQRVRGTSDHGGPNQGQRGLPGHTVRGLSTSARWLRRRPTTSSSSPSATTLSSAQHPSMLPVPP